MPLFVNDNEAVTLVNQVYQRADAFLFGRRTYEIFAGSWGIMTDSDNPIAAALNIKPKYVASTTHTDPRWADTAVLSGDVAAAVGELKAMSAGELQVHGSGPDIALDLVDSRATPSGVTIQVYRPTGRPQYATATPTPST